MDEKTIEFYNTHADEFLKRTQDAEMHVLQNQFLERLPKDASILDLGCGSGRDSLFFLHHGFHVTMVDASEAMCEAAEKLTGQKAVNGDFLSFTVNGKFDGVWACASLLHLHIDEIPLALIHLMPMLKDDAKLYLSFKYGEFEGELYDRYFTYLTEQRFIKLLKKTQSPNGTFELKEMFQSDDVRPGNETKWLNIFLQYRK